MSAGMIPNDDAFARQHRREVIEMAKKKLARESITQPVRLEFDRLPNDDTYEGIKPVGKSGNIWLVAPEPGSKRTIDVKVERLKGTWMCSHEKWKPKEQCIHIKRVRHMLGDDGVIPYDGRRRRPLTTMLYPSGYAEETRRDKARLAEPMRVPALAGELCVNFAKQPDRSETHPNSRGANGAPYAFRAYALLRKVHGNLSYEQLIAQLEQEDTYMDLLGYGRGRLPNRKTFIRWFGYPLVTRILDDLFVETTRPAKRFDTMVVGDSHDIPTRMVDNSRDRKFGPKPAKYRNPNRELVRQHSRSARSAVSSTALTRRCAKVPARMTGCI